MTVMNDDGPKPPYKREPRIVEREAAIIDALRGGPLTARGIATVIYEGTELRPPQRSAIAMVTQSLRVLERDNVVRRLPGQASSSWELVTSG